MVLINIELPSMWGTVWVMMLRPFFFFQILINDMKEKLEEARVIYATASDETKRALESLFPELKENEDERIKKALISRFSEDGELDGISYDRICDYLKRCTIRKKYDDGDEKMLEIILTDINYAQKNYSLSKLTPYDKKINWLNDGFKSLKWKPSKEQMEALRELLNFNIGVFDYKLFQIVNQLYSDLQKL